MSSDNPSVNIAEGVARAVIDWTADKIKEYAIKFKNREIAFVDDIETISIVKEQRETPEWEIFKQYIFDPDLRILFQMGLALKTLEKDNVRLVSLRNTILKKYHLNGLHLAQFVQNGFFGKYLANVLEKGLTRQGLRSEILDLLSNLDKMVVFIKKDDDELMKTEEIVTKIYAHSPKTFIICSTKSAMGKCETIRKKVMKRITGYEFEFYKTDIKEIYFLNKIEL